MKLYTTGYSGEKTPKGTSKPARLLQLAEELNATVFDIRYSPNSRAACWRKDVMMASMKDRYKHVYGLGNRNYNNGGEIDIVNMESGAAIVIETMRQTGRNAILLCGCEEFTCCHRAKVSTFIHRMFDVEWMGDITVWGAMKEATDASN